MKIDYNREEKWKRVLGADLDYYISDKGNLKRKLKSGKFFNLKGHYKEDGYKMFTIKINVKAKPTHCHKLVALAFLDPVAGKEYVNHKDPDKTINYVENLEWCTQTENLIHSKKHVPHIVRRKNKVRYTKNMNDRQKKEAFIRHHHQIVQLMEDGVTRLKILNEHKMPVCLRYLSNISKIVREFKKLYGSIEYLLKNNSIQILLF